jgi:hypothetical protein
MSKEVIEYADGKGRIYHVWLVHGYKPRCEVFELGEITPRRVTNMYDTPEILRRALVWLYPKDYAGTEPSFRFYDRGGCGGPCPEFAA